jgi:hypothetical protein
MSGQIILEGNGQVLISTSGTSGLGVPATGYGSVYFGSDNLLRLMDDTGSVSVISKGPDGTSGTSGTAGNSGSSGISGSSGSSGQSGILGSSGISSSSGSSGSSGSDGGSSGTSGQSRRGARTPQPTQPEFENTALDMDGTALGSMPSILSGPPFGLIARNIAVGSYSLFSLAKPGTELSAQSGHVAIGVSANYTGHSYNFSTTIGTNANAYGNISKGTYIGTNTNANQRLTDSSVIIGTNAVGGKPNLGATGSDVIAIGKNALYNLEYRSDNNIAIGEESLYNLGIATGSTGNNRNLALGYRSGYNITSGSNNTLLGCTGGTAGMTGALVLSNGDNSTEIVLLNSLVESGTYTFNTRLPITIAGSQYYILLST